jgi:hypothetical protein
MAVGVKHQCTVGEVATTHEAEIRAVINELTAAAAKVTQQRLSPFLPPPYITLRLSFYCMSHLRKPRCRSRVGSKIG